MCEELIGIMRGGPLPGWGGSHEVDHAVDEFDSSIGSACAEVLGGLCTSPASEYVIEERLGENRTRGGGR